jgi:hypothetical protein
MAFEIREELQVDIADEPGALSAVLKAVAEAGVDVRALCAYAMEGQGKVHLVPDNATRAREALARKGYEAIVTSRVVVGEVDDKPGAGERVTAKVAAAGVNLEYVYATGTGGGRCTFVLAAGDDAQKTVAALR